jgi:hypothetical protein
MAAKGTDSPVEESFTVPVTVIFCANAVTPNAMSRTVRKHLSFVMNVVSINVNQWFFQPVYNKKCILASITNKYTFFL